MCNGGHEENIPQCISMVNSTEQISNDQLCHDVIRPRIRRPCNTLPCSSRTPETTRRRGRRRRWDTGPWSDVSRLGPQFEFTVGVFSSAMHRAVLASNIEPFDVS